MASRVLSLAGIDVRAPVSSSEIVPSARLFGAFAFLVLHTITWSKLVPKAFFPRSHGHPLPEMTTALPSYILWAIATIVIAAFILGA